MRIENFAESCAKIFGMNTPGDTTNALQNFFTTLEFKEFRRLIAENKVSNPNELNLQVIWDILYWNNPDKLTYGYYCQKCQQEHFDIREDLPVDTEPFDCSLGKVIFDYGSHKTKTHKINQLY